MKRAAFLIVVVALLGGLWAVAQAQSGTIYVGQAFDVYFDHDGVNTNSYRLTITGPVGYAADLPVSALTNGTGRFPVDAGLSQPGIYTIIVTAIGDGGSTPSDPFVLSVAAKPLAPSKARIRIVPR